MLVNPSISKNNKSPVWLPEWAGLRGFFVGLNLLGYDSVPLPKSLTDLRYRLAGLGILAAWNEFGAVFKKKAVKALGRAGHLYISRMHQYPFPNDW